MSDFDDSCELLSKATKEMQELTARLRAATEGLGALWAVKTIAPPEDGFSPACDQAGDDRAFAETVGIAIGEASLCWSEAPKGIFDSTRASALIDRIVEAHKLITSGAVCPHCDWPVARS